MLELQSRSTIPARRQETNPQLRGAFSVFHQSSSPLEVSALGEVSPSPLLPGEGFCALSYSPVRVQSGSWEKMQGCYSEFFLPSHQVGPAGMLPGTAQTHNPPYSTL